MHKGLELLKNAVYKVFKKAAKIPFTILVILIIIVLIVLMVLGVFQTKKDDSRYVEGSWESVPYGASQYTSNVSIDKNGKITSVMTAQEIWDKLIENGSNIDKYLDGPEDLLKLMNAEVVTNYPDTREDPDKEIDWDKLNKNVDSNEVQGIIKFRRAKSDGSSERMTFVDPDTFHGWIEQFNETGDEELKQKILKHFTITQTISFNGSTTNGGNLDYSSSDIVTNISEAIVASAKSTPSPGAGWCEAWAEQVYRNAGLEVPYYPTAYDAYKACVISTETNNIPVGAAVFGTGSGSYAGHVGIYIGNGQVMDNIGEISTSSLEEWIGWQQKNPTTLNENPGWLGWGWLCEEPKEIISDGGTSTNDKEEEEDNNNSSSNNEGASFTKYTDLTDSQLRGIASLCKQEQGTLKGAAAEASLMANLFELRGSSYGQGGSGLYTYVRNSGWFANAASFMDSGNASSDYINVVRNVLVEGKRTIPGYIDEHDCFTDIASATNNGAGISVSDRSQYQSHVTKINNVYGSAYTFYCFPDTNSDPFGYTSEANRQRIGDGYYEFDTGEFTQGDGTSGGTSETKFQVEVATWTQVDTIEEWSDSSMEGSHRTRYTMTTQSINYEEFVSGYTMPFDYLWALTVMGDAKGLPLDLADLVLDSEIEITVHDNLTVTTNVNVEEFQKNHVTVENGVTNTEVIKYYKTTTTITKANTLTIALTKADVWIVDYSQKFIYQQDGESNKYGEQAPEIIEKTDRDSKEPNFVTIFNDGDNYVAKNAILSGADWLFEILEENENTVDMIDTTKYLFNKILGYDKYEVDIDITELYNPDNFEKVSGGIYGGTNEEKVWYTLREAGFSEYAVAGAMGNIYQESGFRNDIVEYGYTDSNGGIGLCQWTNYPRDSGQGRNAQLKAYAQSKGKEWQDADTQVEFLLTELTPGGSGPAQGYASYQLASYKGYNGDMWKNASSPEEAAVAFCWSFERPGSPNLSVREQKAREYYEQFKGKTRPEGAASSGGILGACQEVTQEFLSRGASYTLENLIWGDIERCYRDSTQICCATYVSMVLYKSGALTPAQINAYNYHWTGDGGIPSMLAAAGWHQVSPSEAQPGDVVNDFTVHAMIYAGNGQVWDQTSCVYSSRGEPPCKTTRSYDISGCQIWRAP